MPKAKPAAADVAAVAAAAQISFKSQNARRVSPGILFLTMTFGCLPQIDHYTINNIEQAEMQIS
jgi:hypothetical protein